jgi:diacylglycerol kinase family enzyme
MAAWRDWPGWHNYAHGSGIVIVIYNDASGGSWNEAAIKQVFAKHKVKVEKIYPLKTAEKALGSYLKKSTKIAVIGGDGTISTVAGWIAGSSAVMVPLPGGTLNHFTKDLGIPQDVDEAVAALREGTLHKLDIVTVNGRTFINNSGVGLYPSSLHVRARFEDVLGKWPAAIIGSLRTFVRMRTYTLTVDGEEFRTPFVFVGNNEYRFEQPGITRKSIDKGVLSVFIAKTVSRRKLFWMVILALVGRVHMLDDFEVRALTSLTIHARKDHLAVAMDGEVTKLATPLHYEIQPRSLRVFY